MKKTKRIKLLAAGIILILLAVCALIFLFVFKIDEVNIMGNDICTEEEIREHYLSGPLGNNKIVVMIKDKLDCFEDLPFIRDEDITFEGNDKVTIQVYEKSLVACFYYMGEYIYFDKDGMILAADTVRADNIPCIEGISFTNFTMNEYIQVTEADQISTILAISELVEHYDVYVEKVSFSNRSEVTLFCGDIKVLLGKQSLYDQQIASVSDVLKQAQEKKLSGTIDMKNYKRGDKIILKK